MKLLFNLGGIPAYTTKFFGSYGNRTITNPVLEYQTNIVKSHMKSLYERKSINFQEAEVWKPDDQEATYTLSYQYGYVNRKSINYKHFLYFMFFHTAIGSGFDVEFGVKDITSLSSAQKIFIMETLISDEREAISSYSSAGINEWFNLTQPDVGYFLNSNPGSDIAWGSLTQAQKIDLEFMYNFYKMYFKYENTDINGLEDLYDIIAAKENFRRGIGDSEEKTGYLTPRYTVDVDLVSENEIYSDTFSERIFGKPNILPIDTLERQEQFGIIITSLFFEKPGQGNVEEVLNNQEIQENHEIFGIGIPVEPYKITPEDIKSLIEISKKDAYFNPYLGILDQPGPSLVGQEIKNKIDKWYILDAFEDTTEVKLKKSTASFGGFVSAGVEFIENLLSDPDSTLSETLGQCLLLLRLKELANKSKKLRIEEVSRTWNKKGAPYGGRIYCVDSTKGMDLVNQMSGVKGMPEFVSSTSLDRISGKALKYKLRLYKIIQKDGKELEYPYLFHGDKGSDIFLDDKGNELGEDPVLKTIKVENYKGDESNIKQRTLGVTQGNKHSDKIMLTDFSITIAGDTVATVKSNIDISLTFELNNLEAILAVFQAKDPHDNNPKKTYDYSLSEILSHDILGDISGTNASRILKTAYVPKKNRLMLKIIPELDEKKWSLKEKPKVKSYIENSGLNLDLVLVDYTAKRNVASSQKDTITINFKGFTKSFLNETFCDVLLDPKTKAELSALEIETINELNTNKNTDGGDVKLKHFVVKDGKDVEEEVSPERKLDFCNIEDVRARVQHHYLNIKKKRQKALTDDNGRRYKILEALFDRGKIWSIKFKLEEGQRLQDLLQGNIEKNTMKIIDPVRLSEALNGTPTIIKNKAEIDLAGVTAIGDEDSVDYFYFGDLVDTLMDSIYGEPKYIDPKDKSQGRIQDSLFDFEGSLSGSIVPDVTEEGDTTATKISSIRRKLANFPLKVIMPTFNPIEFNNGTFRQSASNSDKVSLADIPISVSFFQAWYETEITNKGITVYPLASIIINLLNSLVNNTLSDTCYTNGTLEKKYFSLTTDFGYPYFKIDASGNAIYNEKLVETNQTIFDIYQRLQLTDPNESVKKEFITFDNDYALLKGLQTWSGVPFETPKGVPSPIIKKSKDIIKIPRSKHHNYIIFYEQFNSFGKFKYQTGYKNGNRPTLKTDEICEFKKEGNKEKVTTERGGKKETKDVTIDFVQKISFTKANLPMAEEIRFQNDTLNELSTLSAVHDVSVECLPLFGFYPGMLCFVDPNFLEPPEKYGSIPWIMGLGGYHICSKVTHKGKISSGMVIDSEARTSIEAKYVNSGTGNETFTYLNTCGDRRANVQNPDHNSNGAEEK